MWNGFWSMIWTFSETVGCNHQLNKKSSLFKVINSCKKYQQTFFASKLWIFLHRSELFKTTKFIFSLKKRSILKFETPTINKQGLLPDTHFISLHLAIGELKANIYFSLYIVATVPFWCNFCNYTTTKLLFHFNSI